MIQYHKIQTVYKRDPDNNYKTLLEGEFSKPEFEYLKDNIWLFSEKIDGMCLRALWDGSTVEFRGKTDRAQMPPVLHTHLIQTITKEKMTAVFGCEGGVCLYGEGVGCFRDTTQVFLADGGKIQIGKLVNQKLDLRVLTYNVATEQIESSPILNYFKHPISEMVLVNTEKMCKGGQGRFHRIICTPDHLIMTDNGYKKARDLVAGDYVMAVHRDLTFIQEQALLGTLLGDGCCAKSYGISISHSEKQKEYMDLWRTILNGFHISERHRISGHGSNMTCFTISNKERLRDIRSMVLVNGKKQVNNEWLKRLTPISLAVWYMDDGSLENTHRKNQRAALATQGFSRKENELIKEVLYNKFNIECFYHKCIGGSGVSLRLTTKSSETFFTLIAPYIIQSLRYKLPEKLRNIPCCWEQLLHHQESPTALKKCLVKENIVAPTFSRDSKHMYDIQTENGNYFVSHGILVHNSHIQKGGGNYYSDQRAVLFDVHVGEWWLRRLDVEGIAAALGIPVVPIVGEGTLAEMVEMVRKGFNSQWGDFIAEGIVARPRVELKARDGSRIITKIKHKDFEE